MASPGWIEPAVSLIGGILGFKSSKDQISALREGQAAQIAASNEAARIAAETQEKAIAAQMAMFEKALAEQQSGQQQGLAALLSGAQTQFDLARQGAGQQMSFALPRQAAAMSAMQALPQLQHLLGIPAYQLPTSVDTSLPPQVNMMAGYQQALQQLNALQPPNIDAGAIADSVLSRTSSGSTVRDAGTTREPPAASGPISFQRIGRGQQTPDSLASGVVYDARILAPAGGTMMVLRDNRGQYDAHNIQTLQQGGYEMIGAPEPLMASGANAGGLMGGSAPTVVGYRTQWVNPETGERQNLQFKTVPSLGLGSSNITADGVASPVVDGAAAPTAGGELDRDALIKDIQGIIDEQLGDFKTKQQELTAQRGAPMTESERSEFQLQPFTGGADFTASPLYEFQSERTESAIDRALRAQGRGGGAPAAAIQGEAQRALAAEERQRQVADLMNVTQLGMGMPATVPSGFGTTANIAGALGQNLGAQLGAGSQQRMGLFGQMGAAQANALLGMGQTQAQNLQNQAAITGSYANALGQMPSPLVSGLGTGLQLYGMFNQPGARTAAAPAAAANPYIGGMTNLITDPLGAGASALSGFLPTYTAPRMF